MYALKNHKVFIGIEIASLALIYHQSISFWIDYLILSKIYLKSCRANLLLIYGALFFKAQRTKQLL